MIHTRQEITTLRRNNTRELNLLTAHLLDLKEAERKGWRLYLGEPLFLQIVHTENDIDKCYFQTLKFNRYEKELKNEVKNSVLSDGYS